MKAGIVAGLTLAVAACGPAPVGSVCEAGRQVDCPCPDGAPGIQVCANDGSQWGACDCPGTTSGGGTGGTGAAAGSGGASGSTAMTGGGGTGGTGGASGSAGTGA